MPTVTLNKQTNIYICKNILLPLSNNFLQILIAFAQISVHTSIHFIHSQINFDSLLVYPVFSSSRTLPLTAPSAASHFPTISSLSPHFLALACEPIAVSEYLKSKFLTKKGNNINLFLTLCDRPTFQRRVGSVWGAQSKISGNSCLNGQHRKDRQTDNHSKMQVCYGIQLQH